MDFQRFIDSFFSPTCVVSVSKTEDGSYGDYRLVAGNKKYTDMIDLRIRSGASALTAEEGNVFIPGRLYSDYFPQNRSFEEVCYKAAVRKMDIHTYAHLSNVDVWFDIYAMPLDIDEEDTFYCAYTATPQKTADKIIDTNDRFCRQGSAVYR